MAKNKKKVVILGGGFAGVECARQLESSFKNNSEVEIIMISEDNDQDDRSTDDASGSQIQVKEEDSTAKETPEGEFQVLDLIDIGELDSVFDGIFMQAVLLHVPKAEARKRVSEISSKLKPGGYFYIAVKGKGLDSPDEEVVVENDYGYSYERFFSYYTLDEIKDYFIESGLTPIYENAPHSEQRGWIQVIAKK